jgi:gluconate 2-dehydrogenase gamma chain
LAATPPAQAAIGLQSPWPPEGPPAQRAPGTAPWQFLNEAEARLLAAAAARLIPADPDWPSATDAGAVVYIDRQLAGAWGAGDRLYLQGPWREGTPRQGYQMRLTPAEAYRAALAAIDRDLRERLGVEDFAALPPEGQDDYLRGLEAGGRDLGGIPSALFFETLLANVIESFFADPAYGGNRDMAGWRMIGFPGAFAQYMHEVDRLGQPFDRAPVGMAGHRHDHEH